MSLVRSYPPGSAAIEADDVPPLRAKHLAPVLTIDVEHIRSVAKRAPRRESRRLIIEAMRLERATSQDIADALDVDERAASRALRGRLPIDVSEVLCLAASGRGGARLARRILALLSAAVDLLDLSHH